MCFKITRLLLIFISSLVLYSVPALATQINVGSETLHVPAPAGFANLSSISIERLEMFEAMLPETNRLLSVYVTEEDAGSLIRGVQPTFDKYFVVQTVKELEAISISNDQFVDICSIVRQEFENVILNKESIEAETTRAVQSFSKKFGGEISFNVDGVAYLGIVEESTSHISVSFISKYNMSINGNNDKHIVTGVMTILLIRGKVIYLNTYSSYNGEEDLEWTRSHSKSWVSQVISANEKTWPIADGRMIPHGAVVDSQTLELIAGERSEYRSKGHPKAYGLDIGIKYPVSWRTEEGIRPHIVQKFIGQSTGRIVPFCMLVIQELPAWASYFIQGDIAEEMLSENLRDFVPPKADYIGGGKTTYDGESGAWLKYYYEQESAGMRTGMYTIQYLLFYGGKMVSVQCSVNGLADDKQSIEKAFTSHLPLFQNIGNNIVIHDKWNKAEAAGVSSIIKEEFGEFWWITIIISALLTWGIGLLPPILIRFLFFRRPFSQGTSIGISVFFWIVNFLLFTALGSKSRAHTGLLLVAVVSYIILHRGYSKPKKNFEHGTTMPGFEWHDSSVENVNDLNSSNKKRDGISE